MTPIIHLRETLPASANAVFKAWTNPSLMAQWLFKSQHNRIVVASQELTIGGRYSILETTSKNEKIDHYGTYLAIVAGELLSFTLEVPWHFPGVTTVAINFTTDAVGNCIMDFLQSGVEPKIVEDNWKTMFTQLKVVLSRDYDQS